MADVAAMRRDPGMTVVLDWLSACAKGDTTCATNLLTEFGTALLNVADSKGCTGLHFACQNNHPAIVELLLDHPDILVNPITGPCHTASLGRPKRPLGCRPAHVETCAP